MIRLIKEKLAEKQFQTVLKKNTIKTRTPFNTLVDDHKTIVIIYPEGKKEEHEANNSLMFFFKTYPKSEFVLIKPSELKKEELQFSGLPAKSYFDQFKKKKINLLIDLNNQFNFLGCFISGKIRASIKVRLNTIVNGAELYHLSLDCKKKLLKERLECLRNYSLKLKDVI